MNLPCQRCKQARATVHVTDTMPEKRERHLCERCAEKEGIIIKHHTTNELLQEFIKHKAGIGAGEGPSCPKCGMTFREFQSSGQLGCPHDYDVFRNLLTPLIERAHEDATHHVGKIPGQTPEEADAQTDLIRLRRELQQAIDAENYERAAQVRDEIRTMEHPRTGDS